MTLGPDIEHELVWTVEWDIYRSASAPGLKYRYHMY